MFKYILLFLILILFTNCEQKNGSSYQAMVDSKYSGKSGAIIDDTPTFATIGEALSIVPEVNKTPFMIYIRNGRYYEKLSVDNANVHFSGESRDETIISFDACGDTPDANGKKYGTWGSYTLRITASDFYAENLTIENGFDYPANAAKSDDDPNKVRNQQAVALMTASNSDRAIFINCKFVGYQDTYFANAGRQYLYNCQILGHVDFIFGAGQVVFDSCDIVSRNRKNKNPTGYITAPSTPIYYPYGFLFVNSRFLKESPEVPENSVCLGRPWHPTADLTISGSAVFINCFMDNHIGPKGYARISSRDSTGTRIWFEVKEDSRFFEYNNHGPGSKISPNRPTLDVKSAKWYTTTHVLDGWIPVIK